MKLGNKRISIYRPYSKTKEKKIKNPFKSFMKFLHRLIIAFPGFGKKSIGKTS